jgi:hypothetical protein
MASNNEELSIWGFATDAKSGIPNWKQLPTREGVSEGVSPIIVTFWLLVSLQISAHRASLNSCCSGLGPSPIGSEKENDRESENCHNYRTDPFNEISPSQ